MATTEKHQADASYDIVIVGAGLSGVNAAYRVQEGLPHMSYTVLEARDVIGGTWSFFKYPGIRSDSEIASFAFSWAPWDSGMYIRIHPLSVISCHIPSGWRKPWMEMDDMD